MHKRAFSVAEPQVRAISRLNRTVSLDPAEIERIGRSVAHSQFFAERSELASEGREPMRTSILLRGWLAYQRILPDGRRQIIGLTLPGELLGKLRGCQQTEFATQVAVTDVMVCAAPMAPDGSQLRNAYRQLWLDQRSYLVNQITRLGRMDARERLCDLLLELLQRLRLSGAARGCSFDMPLTQDCMADVLGLTPVHLNRTVQACRREGDLSWSGGLVTLHNPSSLARSLGQRLATPEDFLSHSLQAAEVN
jgi:CRP-like cAMP-binding protein